MYIYRRLPDSKSTLGGGTSKPLHERKTGHNSEDASLNKMNRECESRRFYIFFRHQPLHFDLTSTSTQHNGTPTFHTVQYQLFSRLFRIRVTWLLRLGHRSRNALETLAWYQLCAHSQSRSAKSLRYAMHATSHVYDFFSGNLSVDWEVGRKGSYDRDADLVVLSTTPFIIVSHTT